MVTGYNVSVIKSFKHKGLEAFFLTGSLKGIQATHKKKIRSILTILNTLTKEYGLKPLEQPFYRLHLLHGDLKGQWAVTVQANWRITFEYDEKTSDVYIVDYQDYH